MMKLLELTEADTAIGERAGVSRVANLVLRTTIEI